jgi:hypothetical protein
MIVGEANAKGVVELKDLVLALDSEKQGFIFMQDILKHFDDDL